MHLLRDAGRATGKHYMEQEMVEESFASIEAIPAVIDADGRVRAYVDVIIVGEAAIVSRILGHAQHRITKSCTCLSMAW